MGAPPAGDTSAGTHQPGWYPDPSGKHEYRYFDGSDWTIHVASHGQQSMAPVVPAGPLPSVNRGADKVQRDVRRADIADEPPVGGGHLLNEPVLVVNQKAKFIELSNEYAIYDRNGNQLGAVRQVGQSAAKKAVRLLTSSETFLTHKFQVVDVAGQIVLALTRPAKFVKSRVVVQRSDGAELGEIKQQNVFGKIRFEIESGGRPVGSINAENWRAWNFNIQDAEAREVARITKTFEGIAKAAFTTADNYVVQIHRPLDEPLRSMVVAAALCVDTALKQDDT